VSWVTTAALCCNAVAAILVVAAQLAAGPELFVGDAGEAGGRRLVYLE